eukprot:GHVT01100883.1.p1 GENE.GHVT01100883.1~~GHVT01100883.1.p1  ORF type:complete len:176 (+),score=20.12 GHVT01100883.1:276-803(+)
MLDGVLCVSVSDFNLRSHSSRFHPKTNENDSWFVVQGCLKLADIGHTTLSSLEHRKWCMRLFVEFWKQGDEEEANGWSKSPLCDRFFLTHLTSSQSSFISLTTMPLAKSLLGVCPSSQGVLAVVQMLQTNASDWENMTPEELKNMLISHQTHFDHVETDLHLHKTITNRKQKLMV